MACDLDSGKSRVKVKDLDGDVTRFWVKRGSYSKKFCFCRQTLTFLGSQKVINCSGNYRYKQPGHQLFSCCTFFLLLWIPYPSTVWVTSLLDNFPSYWMFENNNTTCMRTSKHLSHCSALHHLEPRVDIKILRQGYR